MSVEANINYPAACKPARKEILGLGVCFLAVHWSLEELLLQGVSARGITTVQN